MEGADSGRALVVAILEDGERSKADEGIHQLAVQGHFRLHQGIG